MSHGLKPYHDSNDPQNAPLEWNEEEDDGYDPFAELDAKESARKHTEEWKSKLSEP